MGKIYSREQIAKIIDNTDKKDIIDAIEAGFVAYSKGQVVVPPVGEMIFESPPGESHIKYGYIIGDDYYVIKIASGFYDNHTLGLPTNSGLVLVFSQKSGHISGILLDEGDLTSIRTAAAGAVVARILAPKEVSAIGVFGAGIQGRLQVEYLSSVIDCNTIYVWGVNQDELATYQQAMEQKGYQVITTMDSTVITENCNLIVTATPSQTPLIKSGQIRPGIHITAMGSDTSEKQELDDNILGLADLVISDSIEQSRERGEIFHARKNGVLGDESVCELGIAIENKKMHRTSDTQITVADLTGVAVQDIQISKIVTG